MAVSVNDKFIGSAPLWTGTIGAGGISDAAVTTFALSSATGLTNGAIYVFTVDRVDANGTKTLAKREVIIGELSTANVINCLRGEEGTAQAHAAGAVVEILMTAKQWNRLKEGLLVEHNETGTHKEALVTTLKASGAVVTTGTSDVTIVTPKALKDAGIVAVTVPTPALTDYANLNLAEGQMINGKIVPSVASNNLTVALKGMDGNDPSASNPVYVRIGSTIRAVTAALSVTKNAGTNWCNAGSAELATKEIDYFAYLGYNATDGVVLGFARIPYGTLYSSFSATSTAETYAGISTITNAAAGDNYVNIGRFAATLSAGAGYTWSVPTFTATNLIQRPIYETRWLNYTPSVKGAGGSLGSYAASVAVGRYMLSAETASVRTCINLSNVGSWSGNLSHQLPIGTSTAGAALQEMFSQGSIGTSGGVAIEGWGHQITTAGVMSFVSAINATVYPYSSLATGDWVSIKADYEI